MKNFMFETQATMKRYNSDKWWIDSDIIRPIIIQAENLAAALQLYRQHCDESCVDVSATAIQRKNAMYIDTKSGETKQVGYVITGKTDFQRDDYTWSTQYIDLWVSISEVSEIDFDDILSA